MSIFKEIWNGILVVLTWMKTILFGIAGWFNIPGWVVVIAIIIIIGIFIYNRIKN